MFVNIEGAHILTTFDTPAEANEYRDKCNKELKRRGLDKDHRVFVLPIELPNGRVGFRVFHANNE